MMDSIINEQRKSEVIATSEYFSLATGSYENASSVCEYIQYLIVWPDKLQLHIYSVMK